MRQDDKRMKMEAEKRKTEEEKISLQEEEEWKNGGLYDRICEQLEGWKKLSAERKKILESNTVTH